KRRCVPRLPFRALTMTRRRRHRNRFGTAVAPPSPTVPASRAPAAASLRALCAVWRRRARAGHPCLLGSARSAEEEVRCALGRPPAGWGGAVWHLADPLGLLSGPWDPAGTGAVARRLRPHSGVGP